MGAAEHEAAALRNLGCLAAELGDYERARALYQQSLDIRRGLWNTLMTASPLAGLGDVAVAQGDYVTARACYEESLAILREFDQQRRIALRLRDLGMVARCQGRYQQAREYLQESLALLQSYQDRAGAGVAWRYLGDVALAEGEVETARQQYRESLMLLRPLGLRKGVAAVLEGWARLEQAEERPQQATRLLGAAQALRETLGSPLPPNEQPAHAALVALLRLTLGANAFTTAWEAGRALSWEQAAALVLNDNG
jgi:tetratricopeptide (TPR) repeat protein